MNSSPPVLINHKNAYITVVHMDEPTGKLYKSNYTDRDFDRNNPSIGKSTTPPSGMGWARTYRCTDVDELGVILSEVSADPHRAIVLGFVKGTEPADNLDHGEDFRLTTVKDFSSRFKRLKPPFKVPKYDTNEEGKKILYATRTAQMFTRSTWFAFDLDISQDMPEELKQRLKDEPYINLLEGLCPELKGVDFLKVSSASSRVEFNGSRMSAANAHIYMQCEQPSNLDQFSASMLIRSVGTEFGYINPVRDLITGEINERIRGIPSSIFDRSVFSRARVMFEGSPQIEPDDPAVLDGKLKVHGSDIEVLRRGKKAVDTLAYLRPTEEQQAEARMFFGKSNGGFTVVNNTDLVPSTSIQVKDLYTYVESIITAKEFVEGDVPRYRAQNPFKRESVSWSAFLSKENERGDPCEPFLNSQEYGKFVYTDTIDTFTELVKNMAENSSGAGVNGDLPCLVDGNGGAGSDGGLPVRGATQHARENLPPPPPAETGHQTGHDTTERAHDTEVLPPPPPESSATGVSIPVAPQPPTIRGDSHSDSNEREQGGLKNSLPGVPNRYALNPDIKAANDSRMNLNTRNNMVVYPLPDDLDDGGLAHEFVKRYFPKQETTLVVGEKHQHQWVGTHWETVSKDDISNLMSESMYAGDVKNVTLGKVKSAVGLAMMSLAKASSMDPLPTHMIPMANGVWDFSCGVLMPHEHCKNYMYSKVKKFEYNPDERGEGILAGLIEQASMGDPEFVRQYKQMAGYLVSGGSNIAHKIMYFDGAPRSGKSLAAQTISALSYQTLGIDIGQIADLKILKNVPNRSLLFDDDAQPPAWNQIKAITGTLKKLSAGDRFFLQQLYTEDLYEIWLHPKILVACNGLPMINDPSGAIHDRGFILPFNKSFSGDEDFSLEGKLVKNHEKAASFNYMVEGYLDLLAYNGYGSFQEFEQSDSKHLKFVQCEASLIAQEESLEDAQPITKFFREKCDFGDECFVELSIMEHRVRQWLHTQPGRENADKVSVPKLKKQIKNTAGRLGYAVRKRATANHARIECIIGLSPKFGA